MTISNLKTNVDLLQNSTKYDPHKSKKNTRASSSKDDLDLEDQDSNTKVTGESINTHVTIIEEGTLGNDHNE